MDTPAVKEVKSISEVMEDALKKLNDDKKEPVMPTADEIAGRGWEMIEKGYQPHDKEIFEKLAKYLAAPNGKGLLLYGKVGTGKTFFFQKMFSEIQLSSALKISEAFKSTNGKMNGMFWYESFWIMDSETWRQSLVIDDMGVEPLSNVYGTVTELMADVIDQRYRDWKKTGVKTYITSNLSNVEMDKRYGRRVTDRIAEMSVCVEFSGTSLRGKI